MPTSSPDPIGHPAATSRPPAPRPDDPAAERPVGAMAPDVADCIEVAARFLAAQPAAVQRALDTHGRRPDGRCSRCGPTVRWPCATVASARRARELGAGR